MQCKQCGTEFHYCVSCGIIDHAEIECCSDACARQRISHLSDAEVAQVLIYEVRLMNWPEFLQRLNRNKMTIGVALIDLIYENQ